MKGASSATGPGTGICASMVVSEGIDHLRNDDDIVETHIDFSPAGFDSVSSS